MNEHQSEGEGASEQPPPGGPPLISVVIPCYNYERYVGQAITSVLSQSYPRREVVVVNDGSTDGSARVIDQFRAQVQIVDQANSGHIRACNRGFVATTGDIVIFLDADDLLLPDALDEIARAWRPACVKVQYDLSIVDAAGADLGRRFCNFSGTYDPQQVRRVFHRTGTYRWPITAGNAYSRWFLETLLPLTIDLAPDGTLNTIAPVYGDIITIPRPLAAYRVHGANGWASNGGDVERLPERIHLRQLEVSRMREHAARQGVEVPPGNVLDHELPFLNYRLMALKLGLAYHGCEADSVAGLLRCVYRTIEAQRLPLTMSLAHLLWFLTLAAVPSGGTKSLVWMRFNRAALRQRMRDDVGKALAHLRAGRRGAAAPGGSAPPRGTFN